MGKKVLIGVVALLFLLLIIGDVSAVNLLTNPGFEDPVAADNTQLNVTPTGWALFGANGGRYLYRPNPPGTYPPTEGAQRFVVSNKTMVVQQVEAIQANTVYTFKVDVLPYTYNANDEGGRISLRIFNGNDYVVLARSEDYRSVSYRVWGVVTAQWDSTNYPQFWGEPLSVAMHVTAANTMFFDNASLEKAPSTKKIRITRTLPEALVAVSENGVTYDFDVELLGQPGADVTITVDPNTVVDVGAGAAAPVSLTFTPSDWNIPQTVTVSVADDATEEAAALDAIAFSASSSDLKFDSSDPNVAASLSSLSVKVVDDDGVGQLLYNGGFELPNADIEARSYYLVADGWAEYQGFAQGYRYDPPSTSAIQPTEGDTRVSLLWGTAMIQPVGSLIEANTGYVFAVDRRTLVTGVDWSLKIACYDAGDFLDPADFVVLAQNRYQSATAGVWERFYVVWNSASAPEYVGKKLAVILSSTLDGVIMDNSTLNKNFILLTETDGSTVVSERASMGNTDTYSIVLTRKPTADVTITATPPADAASIDLGAGAGVPVVLTFTSADWDTPQSITVTAIDDAVNEGKTPKTYVISHSAASSDAYFGGAFVKSVTARVNDDDFAAVLFNDAAVLEVSETGPTSDTYSAYLQIAPTADVTVTLTPSADVTVDPAVLTFSTGDWAVPQTVTVTAVDDTETEANPETATIVHAVSSTDPAYAAVTAITLNVSVTDNDYCGNWGFYQADLNEDCYVNLEDFQIIAAQWLECTHPADLDCDSLLP
jgi:hypothetical protein